MTSKSNEKEATTDPLFKEKFQELMAIEDGVYYLYATYEDPISGKISDDIRTEIIEKSAQIGYDLADDIMRKSPNKSVMERIEENNIELVLDDSESSMKFVYFGTYETDGPITLYQGNLAKSEQLLEDIEIDWLTIEQVGDIILAHELFHYYEDVYPEMYTNTKEIELWKLGPYTHKSKLICPSEIAAMAFAKKLLNLDFNSSAINYLLYSSIDGKAGEAFYKNMHKLNENN